MIIIVIILKAKWKAWGSSSVGRAPRSQRGGRRFDPDLLHLLDNNGLYILC